jgi:putative phosphoribosyl transferase
MVYQDRRDAGKALAEAIAAHPNLGPSIVLALPRGGVPVAFEVVLASKLPLDVLVVRKLGTPGQPELAMGAVTSNGTVFLNRDILRDLSIHSAVVEAVTGREQQHAQQQENLYRGGRPRLDFKGSTVLLVDDGLATGATMRAAVLSLRPHAQRVIVAVPVGAIEACDDLAREADLVLCPWTPAPFGAVGHYYSNFAATTDAEVRTLLAEAQLASS